MSAPRFGGVLTAMVTPFAADGGLDVDAAVALARWLVAQGNDGLVVAGTTGEASTLTDDEKVELWTAVAAAVTVPVIAGTGSGDTRHTAELTARAAAAGVAGALVVTPYYNRPSQAGIEAHFRHVAAATALPVLLYDVPARTGRRIDPATIVRLAHEVPTVVGLKDAAGDVTGSIRLSAELPDDFDHYSGDDAMTLPLAAAAGARGVIGVATHWSAAEHRELLDAVEKGDLAQARAVNARLLASFAYENTDTSPYSVSAKAAMRVLGHAVGECRLPLPPTPSGVEDDARAVLRDLGRDL
jgi:4-hydroxy-tetrahydrodipicolinate synthase